MTIRILSTFKCQVQTCFNRKICCSVGKKNLQIALRIFNDIRNTGVTKKKIYPCCLRLTVDISLMIPLINCIIYRVLKNKCFIYPEDCKSSSRIKLDQLDEKILIKILSFLSPNQIRTMQAVNRLFNALGNKKEIWDILAKKLHF